MEAVTSPAVVVAVAAAKPEGGVARMAAVGERSEAVVETGTTEKSLPEAGVIEVMVVVVPRDIAAVLPGCVSKIASA